MLINDDCLFAMRKIEDESIDMVYLDPPFFTQRVHSLKDTHGIEYRFDDTWDSIEDYVQYIKERVLEIRRLLKKTGSIFLHCNNSASHYLRFVLDEVFGVKNFRNEIIWSYKRWSNSHKGLLNAHQTILMYSKSDDYTFNTIFTEYSPTTNIDQILQDRIRNSDGKAVYKLDENGKTVCTNEKKGVPLSDVWDIPFLNPKAKERVGYPTQKPILLLERIIKVSTNENDVVLDPFCGSGTTLVASALLNRKFIGIDINEEAVELSKARLENPTKTESMLLRLGEKFYDVKNETDKQILSNFECNIVQRNKGIDAFLRKFYRNSLVPIRIQKENEPFLSAVNLLYHAAMKRGCKIMILIKTSSNDNIFNIDIPSEIVVIDSYQLIIKEKIKEGKLYEDDGVKLKSGTK
jgi:site-specific DNA-methyltransferase (adenine-specific)